MFKNENRADDFTINWGDISLDFSKNRLNKTTLDLLLNLATQCDLKNSIEKQFNGDKINKTENRAVLHTAIRASADENIIVDNKNIIPSIASNNAIIAGSCVSEALKYITGCN